jgi:hypothetical protein
MYQCPRCLQWCDESIGHNCVAYSYPPTYFYSSSGTDMSILLPVLERIATVLERLAPLPIYQGDCKDCAENLRPVSYNETSVCVECSPNTHSLFRKKNKECSRGLDHCINPTQIFDCASCDRIEFKWTGDCRDCKHFYEAEACSKCQGKEHTYFVKKEI